MTAVLQPEGRCLFWEHMKKNFHRRFHEIYYLKFSCTFFILTMLWGCSVIRSESQEVQGLSIPVSVHGLRDGDVATLHLLPDSENTSTRLAELGIQFPSIEIQNESIRLDLGMLPDGYYKLIIETPEDYFREPLGYLFMIRTGQLVRDSNVPVIFELIPPFTHGLPPCRVFEEQPETFLPSTDMTIVEGEDKIQIERTDCISEGLISLSGPPKQPEP